MFTAALAASGTNPTLDDPMHILSEFVSPPFAALKDGHKLGDALRDLVNLAHNKQDHLPQLTCEDWTRAVLIAALFSKNPDADYEFTDWDDYETHQFGRSSLLDAVEDLDVPIEHFTDFKTSASSAQIKTFETVPLIKLVESYDGVLNVAGDESKIDDLLKALPQLTKASADAAKLQAKIDALEAAATTLQSQFDTQADQLKTTNAMVTQLNLNIAARDTKITDLEKERDTANTEKAAADGREAKAQSELLTKDTELNTAKTTLNAVQALIGAKDTTTAEMTKAANDKAGIVGAAADASVKLTTDLDIRTAERDDLQRKVTALDDEKTALTAQKTKHFNDAKAFSKKLDQADKDIIKLKGDVNQAGIDKTNLQTALVAEKKEVARLKAGAAFDPTGGGEWKEVTRFHDAALSPAGPALETGKFEDTVFLPYFGLEVETLSSMTRLHVSNPSKLMKGLEAHLGRFRLQLLTMTAVYEARNRGSGLGIVGFPLSPWCPTAAKMIITTELADKYCGAYVTATGVSEFELGLQNSKWKKLDTLKKTARR